jgi:hypothetical protein
MILLSINDLLTDADVDIGQLKRIANTQYGAVEQQNDSAFAQTIHTGRNHGAAIPFAVSFDCPRN